MKYTIIELQNGVIGSNSWTYDESERDLAESKYHSLLAIAAVSSIPVHTVVMLTDVGYVLKLEHYEHPVISNEES